MKNFEVEGCTGVETLIQAHLKDSDQTFPELPEVVGS
jgi:hypothetical protein